LPDLQNDEDKRGIEIGNVGITNVLFPVKIRRMPVDGEKGFAPVSARTKLFVKLPKAYKGVNMSRFYECLNEFSEHVISSDTMPRLLTLLQTKLKSIDSYARFEFDYYINRKAPVSKLTAPQAYRCAFAGVDVAGEYTFITEVNVIAASVCPCSREMSLLKNLNGELKTAAGKSSDYIRGVLDKEGAGEVSAVVGMGAHNQRSNIRVRVIGKDNKAPWIEELVDMIEAQASAPVYPILKRADEKYVTEQGYKNAKFSEDITRDVQLSLMHHSSIDSWSLRVFNEESIHPYDVTCYQQSDNWKF
jgi:GTP cyclohydrolase I